MAVLNMMICGSMKRGIKVYGSWCGGGDEVESREEVVEAAGNFSFGCLKL